MTDAINLGDFKKDLTELCRQLDVIIASGDSAYYPSLNEKNPLMQLLKSYALTIEEDTDACGDFYKTDEFKEFKEKSLLPFLTKYQFGFTDSDEGFSISFNDRDFISTVRDSYADRLAVEKTDDYSPEYLFLTMDDQFHTDFLFDLNVYKQFNVGNAEDCYYTIDKDKDTLTLLKYPNLNFDTNYIVEGYHYEDDDGTDLLLTHIITENIVKEYWITDQYNFFTLSYSKEDGENDWALLLQRDGENYPQVTITGMDKTKDFTLGFNPPKEFVDKLIEDPNKVFNFTADENDPKEIIIQLGEYADNNEFLKKIRVAGVEGTVFKFMDKDNNPLPNERLQIIANNNPKATIHNGEGNPIAAQKPKGDGERGGGERSNK